jgi:hypothetical protein
MPIDPNDDLNNNQPVVVDDPNIAPPPPNPPLNDDDDPEFASMTARERGLVTKARAQEKRKLYKAQDELRKQVGELQTELRTLRQAPPPPTAAGQENRDASIERLASMIQETQNQLREMQTQEMQRRRQSELRQYAAERISEMQREGKHLVTALVGGDSEQDIDQSIGIARAEFLIAEETIRAQDGRNRTAPASVTVGQHSGRPTGVAPVVTPNTVVADPQEEIMAEITSDPDAAVRSGNYQKNRNTLLGKLKRNYRYGQSPA